jgi:GH15 family glucan-1,4-alpha-glucosidase
MAAIAAHLGFEDRAAHWTKIADAIRATLLDRAWNSKRGAFTAAFDVDDLDASVLLLPELGLLDAEDPRFVSTVNAIEKELLHGKHVMRYAAKDDFGLPETEFVVCRFWLIDAWASIGRVAEARDMFEDALRYRNRYGLLSEDIHPVSGALWGNFPQTYSMAGLITSAMRLSRGGEDRRSSS